MPNATPPTQTQLLRWLADAENGRPEALHHFLEDRPDAPVSEVNDLLHKVATVAGPSWQV